ncbi:hypothetical protein NPS01_43370 [Nocardioides psychrotolerans]|uniref:ARB-07466-like C-terminal domain-containing protein n=1 Tax=Nocardioides psychrotolerans TaxID=1005945 RepID=A0A1I3RUX1_9ACTN|nr:hypothetical protein [Nocardioides psychrotolerans]GEP40674.1 hypothetical protein NPS01_43370 [Nocardioides psychrotolerans]SFJ49016.1 hypothetical protein SAMN05216561_1369 [Nocardioides psychrotolerans]
MADHRHERDTNARRKPRAVVIAGPLAFLATASAVTLGVLTSEPASSDLPSAAAAPASAAGSPDTPSASESADLAPDADRRSRSVSRSASRSELSSLLSKSETMQAEESTRKAIKNADTRLWTTTTLNLWTEPGDEAREVGEIEPGEKVLVTGRELYGRDEIVLDGRSRWVTAGYLSTEEPATLGGACTNGTSVPSGVSPNIVAVHAAVCANFPEITTYGTFRSDGEHSQGLAVDIMVSGDRGWEVAEFVRENYEALGVSYLIYSQNIWSVERSGEGFRGMEDRGSTTANHYDHVHVTTY